MRTPPEAITTASIVAELGEHWRVDATEAEYLPVGFGSHHWRVDSVGARWFVTVDDLETKLRHADEPLSAAFERLLAALTIARSLHDRGLQFVVAPLPDVGGAVVHRLDDRFAISLYPHVDGRNHDWGGYESLADRLAVLECLIEVHGAPADIRSRAPVDDFVLWERDELEGALDDLAGRWDGGPYADRARASLARGAAGVEPALARFDRLVQDARERPERAVLTHGEPHVGNTLRSEAGWRLVDWDTTLVAPPERDLWMLNDDDGRVVVAYAAATGRDVLADTLEQYRLGWDLTEIALFVAQFRRQHIETEDTAVAWTVLERILEGFATG